MKKTTIPLILAAVLYIGSTAQADVVQLDLGAVATYSGTLAPAGITDPVWNGVPNGDIVAGSLVFGDGTAAPNISVDIGASPENNNGEVINFTGANARGNGSNTDVQGVAIYDTDLTDDWVFTRRNADLGLRVSGLDAGVYDVYAYTKEPNELTRTYDVGIGAFAAADADSITRSSAGLDITSIADATGSTDFVDGLNFALTRVTVSDPSDFVVITVDNTNQGFATLGAVQIVSVAAVPEPSSLALLSLGGLGLLLRRRR